MYDWIAEPLPNECTIWQSCSWRLVVVNAILIHVKSEMNTNLTQQEPNAILEAKLRVFGGGCLQSTDWMWKYWILRTSTFWFKCWKDMQIQLTSISSIDYGYEKKHVLVTTHILCICNGQLGIQVGERPIDRHFQVIPRVSYMPTSWTKSFVGNWFHVR